MERHNNDLDMKMFIQTAVVRPSESTRFGDLPNSQLARAEGLRHSPAMNRDEIIQCLRQQRSLLLEQFGVRNLALFGSYVRAEQEAGSDVDLLVEFERVPSLFDFVRLQEALSLILGLKVDLVMKSALKPGIASTVLREAAPV